VDSIPVQETHLTYLARTLAELVHRLRRFFGPEDSCDVRDTRSAHASPESPLILPATLPRLMAVVSLLEAPQLTERTRPLASLAPDLRRLVDLVDEHQELNPAWLEPALDHLAQGLEWGLVGLDRGLPAGKIANAPQWLGLMSRLSAAGTPLAVMDELDACCQDWEDVWADRLLSDVEENLLRTRWQTFREYGDAMFGGQEKSQSDQPGLGWQVVLLVAGKLRREQLTHKLNGLGYGVLKVENVAEVLARNAQEGPVRAIICDNQEPTNHLASLASLGQQLQTADGGLPPLILVGPASGHSQGAPHRARALGADGLWVEPFALDPWTGLFPGRD
jgi:CheY-like chemotaxis protein